MVNSKIKLIGLDLDGTLIDPSGKIERETIEILEKVTEVKGIKIAVVTSRSFEDVLPVFFENGLRYFPSIIIAEEREIYISKDGIYQPLSEEWNNWIIKEEEKILPTSKKLLKKWAKELQKKGLQFSFVSEEIEKKRKYPSLKFVDVNQAERARRYVEKELSFLNVPLRAGRPGICLDIRSNKTGKGKTLNKLLQLLKISPTSVLCIGDSHNDLEMLDGRYGFQSGCPANAEEVVKKAVLKNKGYIAQEKYGRGVIEIIERLL